MLALLLMLACGQPAPEQPPSATPAVPPSSSAAKVPTFALPPEGGRWQTDVHTRESMGRLLPLLRAKVPDARAHAAAIDAELAVLVKGCTMTGAAHDQLHVFLGALFPLVTTLAKSDDASELSSAQEQLVQLASAYEVAFE